MEKPTKKDMLMDTTMRIVAQGGLAAFSMRQVTKEIGVSEALIYRHYETKENLLFQCFQDVDRQIADLFNNAPFPTAASEKELYEYIHGLWMKYFTFLVRNSYKTLYYFEYRDSFYYEAVLIGGKYGTHQAQTYYKRLSAIFEDIDKKHHIFQKIPPGLLWHYVLDVTGVFAKQIIRGKLAKDEQSFENIWRLIYSGLSGLL